MTYELEFEDVHTGIPRQFDVEADSRHQAICIGQYDLLGYGGLGMLLSAKPKRVDELILG